MLPPILIALAVATLLGIAWGSSRRVGALRLALCWLVYAVYELLMYVRVLCSGECNIRVDLLLIYPALIGATLLLCGSMGMHAMRQQKRRHRPFSAD